MFKNKLLELMSKNSITSTHQLSILIDIPNTTINDWINTGKLPNYTEIRRVSYFFNVPCNELIERKELLGASLISLRCSYSVRSYYLNRLTDDFITPTDIPINELFGYYDIESTAAAMHDNASLTEKEKALLKAFRNLLPETQDFVLRTVQLSETDSTKTLKKS